MARAKKSPAPEEKKPINWIGWALGVGGSVTVAGLLWLIQFFAFGFEEYVKEVAATAQAVDSQQFQAVELDISTIKQTLIAEADRNREFREQQQEDMRNLIQIISRRAP